MNENSNIKEGISYLIFGVLTTIVNFVCFAILKATGLTKSDAGFFIGNGISWIAAVSFAYFTNRRWVFTSRANSMRERLIEAAKFFGGRLFSGIFEIVLPTPLKHLMPKKLDFEILGKKLSIDDQWLAKMLVTVLVIILNYLISKFFVFRKKEKE